MPSGGTASLERSPGETELRHVQGHKHCVLWDDKKAPSASESQEQVFVASR